MARHDSCDKDRLGRAAPTTARRRWDPAQERRTPGSQATPRHSPLAGSRSRLIDYGDDLPSAPESLDSALQALSRRDRYP